jgi:hypothetical protein
VGIGDGDPAVFHDQNMLDQLARDLHGQRELPVHRPFKDFTLTLIFILLLVWLGIGECCVTDLLAPGF